VRDRVKQREYQRQWKVANPDKVREYGKRTRAKHPDRVRAYKHKWVAENRDRHLAYRRKWARMDRARNPERQRDTDLARYGISAKEYQVRLDAQGGLCAICARPETYIMRGKLKRLAVDHDHATGRVRDLICHSCNTLLGMGRDNPTVLMWAANYLLRHGAPEPPKEPIMLPAFWATRG